MVSSIRRFEPPLIVRKASAKVPERIQAPLPEGKTFYIITGMLALSAGLLAVIAVVSVVVVFSGGVS